MIRVGMRLIRSRIRLGRITRWGKGGGLRFESGVLRMASRQLKAIRKPLKACGCQRSSCLPSHDLWVVSKNCTYTLYHHITNNDTENPVHDMMSDSIMHCRNIYFTLESGTVQPKAPWKEAVLTKEKWYHKASPLTPKAPTHPSPTALTPLRSYRNPPRDDACSGDAPS